MPKDIALWANPLSALTLKETFEIVFKLGLADPLTFPHFKCKQYIGRGRYEGMVGLEPRSF